MLNKVLDFVRQNRMVEPGDRVVCALSGGADSVALLFALYLLREKLDIQLSAAHFNHQLRGEESDRDEAFVQELCHRYDIPLHIGRGQVVPGKKGLEAAARDARYGFLKSIPGKIATAHTADDNAETVLLHLVRGTGLKGLGGITPVYANVIRPMLSVTRQEVTAFLNEWGLNWIEDSSNDTDAFLRNRLRHHVMPLLKQENPQFAECVSAMALRLRQDEGYLSQQVGNGERTVPQWRQLHPAVRSRALERFLKDCGVREPEAEHIALAESLIFSDKPSAKARFPGGVTIARNYDRLEKLEEAAPLEEVAIPCPGTIQTQGMRITCAPAKDFVNTEDTFTVCPKGAVVLRCRQSGDIIRLPGGSKSLKKLFIDRKIPASQRQRVPVIADEAGVLAVCGVGVNLERTDPSLPAIQIRIQKDNGGNENGKRYSEDPVE